MRGVEKGFGEDPALELSSLSTIWQMHTEDSFGIDGVHCGVPEEVLGHRVQHWERRQEGCCVSHNAHVCSQPSSAVNTVALWLAVLCRA